MSGKNVSKDVLNSIKKKTGKSVSEQDIQKLASGVKPSTLQSEKQLRQLIQQVSSMVNIPVSEKTINEIVSSVKKSGVNPNSMESMMKLLTGQK
ncbi:stage VI sporulation protein F [Paenibacillus koleovorans]|uniref:stage VI sporulation protein F n=1 Tax=Paenibacillus koleovorans TaxID=121608 RepID=UPI000FDAC391|nr:stage VI sporulation protein F [Paenibacillus koleovorans]